MTPVVRFEPTPGGVTGGVEVRGVVVGREDQPDALPGYVVLLGVDRGGVTSGVRLAIPRTAVVEVAVAMLSAAGLSGLGAPAAPCPEPSRVLVREADGGTRAVPPSSERGRLAQVSVVFVRTDGWSLGATPDTVAEAHSLWRNDWTHYGHPGSVLLPISLWRTRQPTTGG